MLNRVNMDILIGDLFYCFNLLILDKCKLIIK